MSDHGEDEENRDALFPEKEVCAVTLLGLHICSNPEDLFDDVGDNTFQYYECSFGPEQKALFGLPDCVGTPDCHVTVIVDTTQYIRIAIRRNGEEEPYWLGTYKLICDFTRGTMKFHQSSVQKLDTKHV